jgi:hypothetical protein
MGFESVRGYIDLASGLGELTRARAMDAAQGLLSLPAAGGKVAVQAGALAEELLATATANRSNLTELVRSEVDVAMTRLGLVPAQKLEDAMAEATRLRAEVARLRSVPPRDFTGSRPAAKASAPAKKAAASRSTAKKAAAPGSTAKKAASPGSTARRSAVTTRAKPTGT